MGTVRGFHVDRLSLFDGTHAEEAFDFAFALRDRRHQHLVERFVVGYRGDVKKHETMESLIQFTDDASPVWMSFDKNLSDTEAFESLYCTSLPQLVPLPDPRRGQEEEDGHVVAHTHRRISPSR